MALKTEHENKQQIRLPMTETNVGHLLHELEKCTVAIKVAGQVKGSGLLVTADGLILTCYHVIGNRDIKSPFSDDIKVILSGPEPSPDKSVTFEQDKSNPDLDIAFLRLEEKFDNAGIAKLDKSHESSGHTFIALGFRKPKIIESGMSAKGEIRGLVRSSDNILLLQVNCNEISRGMSGSAVLDIDVGRVVGMISLHYSRSDERTLSFAIPVESIVQSFPNIERENPGLKQFSKFLEAIGKSESLLYNRFEEVYVPPIEYLEIEKTLEENHCVFITGTPEYGKTYTAVKLLWEFYRRGYTPMYLKGDQKDVGPIIEKLVEQNTSIRNHVMYLEDPVGQIEYQPNNNFEEQVGPIIYGLANLNAYLVITMREKVHQEFKPLGKEEIKGYVKTLNLANQSYDYEKRKEILLKRGSTMECKWLKDENLKKCILEYIKNDSKLPTPMNIKDFVIETIAIGNVVTNTEQSLRNLIDKHSQRTPERFADEIMAMKEDEKIIFLTFPYLGKGYLDIDVIKNVYDCIIAARESSQQKKMKFNVVRKYFEGDKVNIYEPAPDEYEAGRIEFSHPSYYEAFRYAVDSDRPESARIRKIFVEVLMKTRKAEGIQDDDIADVAASTIVRNFDKMPPTAHRILFSLASSSDTNGIVFTAIAEHFDKLPSDKLEQLFFMVAHEDRVAIRLSPFIIRNFHMLPVNVRRKLFTLDDSDLYWFPESVAEAIAVNFNNLPTKIVEQFLLKLADEDEATEKVSSIVKDYSNNIRDSVRKEILAKLEEKGIT